MDGRCARLASGSERDSRDAVNGPAGVSLAPWWTNLIARVSAGKGPFFRRLGPRNCCWFVGQGRAGLIGRGVGGGKAREEDEGKCEDVI